MLVIIIKERIKLENLLTRNFFKLWNLAFQFHHKCLNCKCQLWLLRPRQQWPFKKAIRSQWLMNNKDLFKPSTSNLRTHKANVHLLVMLHLQSIRYLISINKYLQMAKTNRIIKIFNLLKEFLHQKINSVSKKINRLLIRNDHNFNKKDV